MKLIVAGCSFSDYCQVKYPYGVILASKLNAEYIHEGAGAGSNWRIWRRITKYIIDKIITPDDLLLVQYTERTRNEFCSVLGRDEGHYGPSTYEHFGIVDKFDKDYSIIRYKLEAETWQDNDEEKHFFSEYAKYFVVPKFAEEQFKVHNFMFQQMLLNCKIRTIFIGSHRNPALHESDMISAYLPYMYKDPTRDIEVYNLAENDFGHMSQEGHEVFAEWLYTHINKTNILNRPL